MAKSKRRAAAKAAHVHRASWKGQLSFGLVSFPVEAYNALDRGGSDIHFNQLHAACHSRIKYQKVCPIHGEVTQDEIVSGYEVSKGKYVEIDPDELDALRTENERALKIESFVAPDAIDPLYFDGRMYYLAPAAASAKEPYAVLVEAMERENRYGMGQVVLSGKDQIVLVRTLEGVLHMAMLNYEAEIRPPAKVVGALTKPKDIARQVRLAQRLIEEWSLDKFDFSGYVDTHRERVEELIASKSKGKKVAAPAAEEEEPVILNLMDALKKSMGSRKGKSKNARNGRISA